MNGEPGSLKSNNQKTQADYADGEQQNGMCRFDLLRLIFHSRAQLAAENLFLRKQLVCYIERQVRPRRTDDASRIALVLLSQFVKWRELLRPAAGWYVSFPRP